MVRPIMLYELERYLVKKSHVDHKMKVEEIRMLR